MVRKSDRNKIEKERPASTRKTTRSSRRRRKSTSESEPDIQPEAVPEEISLPPQPVEVGESSEARESKGRGRGRPKKQAVSEEKEEPPLTVQEVVEEKPADDPTKDKEWKEDGNFWDESKPPTADQPKVNYENSTWKIQSSNGSGGEIQKLTICRQRLTDSAESSSSPSKELSSPRRKRYRKRKDLEGAEFTESTRSHTNPEMPSGSVVEAPSAVGPISEVQEITAVEEVDLPSFQYEIPLISQETTPVAETESTPLEVEVEQNEVVEPKCEDPVMEIQEKESVVEDETSEQVEKEGRRSYEGEESEPVVKDEKSTQVVEGKKTEKVIEEENSEQGMEGVKSEPVGEEARAEEVEESTIQEAEPAVETAEAVPEKVEHSEVTKDPETRLEHVKVAEAKSPEKPSSPTTVDEVEEGELKTSKKPGKNLKLAVSNEDAMQQIAKKLNERAARFSKEATEEAAKKSAPHKPSKVIVEEEEEEGEISRDPAATKTLELMRLKDGEVEPTNKRERRRRAVTKSSPKVSSEFQMEDASELTKNDVSTEVLSVFITETVEPVLEEEVANIINPKEDEPEVKEMASDDTESEGEIYEEEGDVVETEKEERRKFLDEVNPTKEEKVTQGILRSTSREESKRVERRVTKESSKKSSKSDRKERRPSVDEPRAKKKFEKEEKKLSTKQRLGVKVDRPEAPKAEENHKAVRKIEIVPDDGKAGHRSVSPSVKKPAPVLFITNLVRPFTIGQLRELLARTGTISPNGFYIDKIKSKCFVKYNDVEMAVETRHALHGVRWPVTNPRTLRVDFSSDEAMEAIKRVAEEEDNAARKQDLVAQNLDKIGWLSDKDVLKTSKKSKNSVREWDMGKDVSEVSATKDVFKKDKEDEWGVKSKDRRVERQEEGGKKRQTSPILDKTEPAKKTKRQDTEAPAKLLDDLFRKTKATPCIYWLPLTADQIAVKEEMRRQHMAEHLKRQAELRKNESARRNRDKIRDRERERERGTDRKRK